MAKRRNLKKEKALRNEAYARKFRKRPQRGRNGRRNDTRSQGENTEEKKTEETTENTPAPTSSAGATD